jgi:hypothetical protein
VGAVDEGAATEFVVDAHHAFEGRAGELGAGGGHGERGEGRAECGAGGRTERSRGKFVSGFFKVGQPMSHPGE